MNFTIGSTIRPMINSMESSTLPSILSKKRGFLKSLLGFSTYLTKNFWSLLDLGLGEQCNSDCHIPLTWQAFQPPDEHGAMSFLSK